MLASIRIQDRLVQVDLAKPIDLAIPVANGGGVNAWYVDRATIRPHQDGDFVGSVAYGNSVNFRNIRFNPHAHGTHTETIGHISAEMHPVNRVLPRFFFRARLISINPQKSGGDLVLTKEQLMEGLEGHIPEALVIRTLPNPRNKMSREYAHTNWPYLAEDGVRFLRESGILHLLTDTPSVDKEKDDGALLAHKAFWGIDIGIPREDATITELIYVPDEVPDGDYLLELQVASFVNDAAPSRPMLYQYIHDE